MNDGTASAFEVSTQKHESGEDVSTLDTSKLASTPLVDGEWGFETQAVRPQIYRRGEEGSHRRGAPMHRTHARKRPESAEVERAIAIADSLSEGHDPQTMTVNIAAIAAHVGELWRFADSNQEERFAVVALAENALDSLVRSDSAINRDQIIFVQRALYTLRHKRVTDTDVESVRASFVAAGFSPLSFASGADDGELDD